MKIDINWNEHPEIKRKLQEMMPRSPSWRYFSNEKGDRYFWTVEKINHNDKPRYVAGIYRHIKTKKLWKMVKKVGFAKRYKAKEWALKMKRTEATRKTTEVA